MEVDATKQPPQENQLLEIELGRSVSNVSPVDEDDNTKPEFVGGPDLEKVSVDQQNLADMLGKRLFRPLQQVTRQQ